MKQFMRASLSRERENDARFHTCLQRQAEMNSAPQEAPVEAKTLGMVKGLLKKN